MATALRFAGLGEQSFWRDEAATVEVLAPSLTGMLGQVAGTESTPPLYYLLAWGWGRLLGIDEWGLRSLSALIGVATVPATFAAARHFAANRAALVAAALVTCSPMLVWFSQEARAYGLLVLGVAASLLVFARAWEAPTPRRLAAWALVCGLMLLTHYYAVFLVIAQAALLAAALPDRRRAVAGAACGVGLVGLAVLPLAIRQVQNRRIGWIREIPLGRRLDEVGDSLLTGSPGMDSGQLGLVVLVVVAASVVGLALRMPERERGAAALAGVLAALALTLPLAAALVGIDLLLARNLIPAWIPLIVALAAVLASRRAGWWGGAVVLAVCLVGVVANLRVAIDPGLQRENWRAVSQALGRSPDRALAIRPTGGAAAMRVYGHRLTELPAAGVTVREVDLVGTLDRPAAARLPGGFRLASRARVDEFEVLRFTAPRPLRVAREHLPGGRVAILFEPAGGGERTER